MFGGVILKEITNISFKGYKAFSSDEYVKLDDIARVNVIIGKNNSGKTSLLDVMELVYCENAPIRAGLEIDDVCFDIPFDREMVNAVFNGGLSGINGWNRSTLQEYVQGKVFSIKIKGNKSIEILDNKLQDLGGHINGIVNTINSRRHLYKFRKKSAERSINPEVESEIQLECNGDGATNLIRTFINNCNFDEALIESELLQALNYIMMPEAEYESIRVQQVNYQGTLCWEVFLQEKGMHIDKTEILDDLDVKASDLLQSNGIIWVEGPSDRIYIKRWLKIFTENKLEEGKDYQFLYYGGRLLSQYSAQEETELISIITTNRNAAIVIDSDKRRGNESINDTKKRIVQEFKELNMFSWVTKGKEIENYLPKSALETMLEITIRKECGQYSLFSDYVEKYYKNFSHKKVPFANKIKEYITFENSIRILDLKSQVEKLYKQMKKWNG